MIEKRKKIVIATGGTGGHVLPALSLSNYLKNNYEIEIFSDKRGLKYFKNTENVKVIKAGSIFNKNLFKTIINLNKIFFSVISCFFYFKKNKPDIVFGMGGYSSFPACLASYLLKVPIIIYENNLVIGRANKVLLPFVSKILLSTNNISGIKKKYEKKILISGYLLRDEIFELENINNTGNNDQLSILIFGGSQSAKIFGEKVTDTIVQCNKKNIKFKIHQQCLEEQMDEIKKIYSDNKINFKLFSFAEKLSDHYKIADLAITRSGASSIAELINLRIPFIAIPLPSSADNHQLKNANNFQKKGYCFLIEEKFIYPKLFEILNDLNKKREKLLELKNKMKEHSDKDSLSKVSKFIEKFLNEKN
tara:strand:- start:109 stop:1197 length:1089 start_codon:yes stop_codon:yes gene_type:complete